MNNYILILETIRKTTKAGLVEAERIYDLIDELWAPNWAEVEEIQVARMAISAQQHMRLFKDVQ